LKEYVGECQICGKEVYCLDGFIDGVVNKDGVICFSCVDKGEMQENEK
jgi:hypothetical protein